MRMLAYALLSELSQDQSRPGLIGSCQSPQDSNYQRQGITSSIQPAGYFSTEHANAPCSASPIRMNMPPFQDWKNGLINNT